MLTGQSVVFVGGDARTLEVITHLTELGASAALIGFDTLRTTFSNTLVSTLREDAFRDARAIVLPVAGMDEDGRVDAKYSEQPIVLGPEHFAALPRGATVFTGIARPRLTEMCEVHRLKLVKLMDLDEVAILNSIPTAEGALALAMEHTDITIHGSNSVVLGFGRCGQTLTRVLAAIGSRVKVGARQPAHFARIREMQMNPFPLSDLAENVANADIVFNTIPYPILPASILSAMPKACVIIDLASKPGGTDFGFAKQRGMTAILAPSLPGIVAPKTAGRIIASSVASMLARCTQGEEGLPWS